jgi:hypothetical protein
VSCARKKEHFDESIQWEGEQLDQFEMYADAVAADCYRVTCIKMGHSGSKQTFILDKKDGITTGFTRREIQQRMPEMLRLQQRGENLYYTPLSNKKHHILVDDMSREKLERLVEDGYSPAALLESSPGNFQAIITVRKMGSLHDRDVGNRLSDALNREYGDPKLSGCIHPHRAPGFENRKPKHQMEDGSYPMVRLVRAVRRECEKALALSSQIDGEYQRQAAFKALRPELTDKLAKSIAAVNGSAIDAYQQHYRDVIKRQRGGEVDLSRVDSMIAVRMRVTGRNQADIEGAIYLCAPSIRPNKENHDWVDYANRTAKYAFSGNGDRQVAELTKYRRQWVKLERGFAEG